VIISRKINAWKERIGNLGTRVRWRRVQKKKKQNTKKRKKIQGKTKGTRRTHGARRKKITKRREEYRVLWRICTFCLLVGLDVGVPFFSFIYCPLFVGVVDATVFVSFSLFLTLHNGREEEKGGRECE
jgi:hypothetical protein